MRVDQVLQEFGHALLPMRAAPRDGTKILAYSVLKGMLTCFWDIRPTFLVGPVWVEQPDAKTGYVDRYFQGWLDPRLFKPLGEQGVRRLLIAYIDEARENGDPLTFMAEPQRLTANDR